MLLTGKPDHNCSIKALSLHALSIRPSYRSRSPGVSRFKWNFTKIGDFMHFHVNSASLLSIYTVEELVPLQYRDEENFD